MRSLLCLFDPSVLVYDSEETSDLMINFSKGKIKKSLIIKKIILNI